MTYAFNISSRLRVALDEEAIRVQWVGVVDVAHEARLMDSNLRVCGEEVVDLVEEGRGDAACTQVVQERPVCVAREAAERRLFASKVVGASGIVLNSLNDLHYDEEHRRH